MLSNISFVTFYVDSLATLFVDFFITKFMGSYKGTVGRTAPNRLMRKFDVKEPDKVWGTDVTEFRTDEGKVYLSPIKDFCTGEIISYEYSASPTVDM